MPLPSQPLPTVGEANSSADPKVRAALSELQTIISGLGAENIATGAVSTDELAVKPWVRLMQPIASTIPNNSLTALAFGGSSEVADATGMHDTAVNSSRITVATAGVYEFHGNVQWASNATGARIVLLRKNGTTYIGYKGHAAASGVPTQQQVESGPVAMNATDYVELMVQQTSGGALNVEYAPDYSPVFTAMWRSR